MARYETDGSSALAPNDPYRNMERSSTRPDLKVIKGGTSTTPDKTASAQSALSAAEKSAAAPISTHTTPESAEKSNLIPFPAHTTNVTGRPDAKSNQKSKSPLSGLKKSAPATIILLLFFGTGVLLSSMLGLLGAHIIEALQKFNPMHAGIDIRNKTLTKTIIKSKAESKNYLDVFGDPNGSKYKRISATNTARLSAEGMSMSADRTHFIFKGAEGDEDLYVYKQNPPDDCGLRCISFDEAFETIPDFKNGYLKGTQTFRGRISGWFDSGLAKVVSKLGLDRNLFKNWSDEVAGIDGGNTAYRERMARQNPDGSTTKIESYDEESTEDGDRKTVKTSEENIDASSTETPQQKNQKAQTSLASRMQSIASKVNSIACVSATVVTGISLIVAAEQISQAVHYASSILTGLQMAQAGDNGPINNILNDLTAPTKTTTVQEDGTETKEGDAKSALEASGMVWAFGGIAQPDNASRKFSSETLFSVLGVTAAAFATCYTAQMLFAGVSLVINFIPGVKQLSTGIKGFGTAVANALNPRSIIQFVLPVAAQATFFAFLPNIAQLFIKNVCVDTLGLDSGHCLALGTHNYLNDNGRQGTGNAPGTIEQVTAYYRESQAIIARDAELERQTKSPFDITSPYTFLGSIVTNILPHIGQLRSISGSITSVNNLLGSSLSNLLPSASADALTASELSRNKGDCPLLEDVGITAYDIYCTPFLMSDLTTKDDDPEGIALTLFENNNFIKECVEWEEIITDTGEIEDRCIRYIAVLDDTGNEIIDEKSGLAEYIALCNTRSSPYGAVDLNILDVKTRLIKGNEALDTITKTALGLVPIVGDMVDLAEGFTSVRELPTARGSNCVANEDTNTKWEDQKYYQQYIEDQRILENRGAINKSPVTAFLESQEALYPQDDSYEAHLASLTGMRKEQVVSLLEEMEYQDFLASYDPTDLGPTPQSPAPATTYDFTPTTHLAHLPTTIVPHHIIYAPIRYRNHPA